MYLRLVQKQNIEANRQILRRCRLGVDKPGRPKTREQASISRGHLCEPDIRSPPLLPNGRNISDQGQDREKFLGRFHSSEQAEMLESTKFTIRYVVMRQELAVFDKPVP
jgi:hypothetical protein